VTPEYRHLVCRLEVQLRTVELDPTNLEAADELERIRAELLALDLEYQQLVDDAGEVSR